MNLTLASAMSHHVSTNHRNEIIPYNTFCINMAKQGLTQFTPCELVYDCFSMLLTAMASGCEGFHVKEDPLEYWNNSILEWLRKAGKKPHYV